MFINLGNTLGYIRIRYIRIVKYAIGACDIISMHVQKEGESKDQPGQHVVTKHEQCLYFPFGDIFNYT